MKNKKIKKEEDDLFNIPLRNLEVFLTNWEMGHMGISGKPICEDISCMGSYLMILRLYEYRNKLEKRKKIVDLVHFQKLGIFDEKKSRLLKIVGFTARRFQRGDFLVLINDIPETMNKYEVKEMKILSPLKDGVIHFEADIEYKGFEQDFKNN